MRKTININQIEGWPEQLPVTIYPTHFNIGDKVWLVYVRENHVGEYNYYVGEVTISAIRRAKRYVEGKYGLQWRYNYMYLIASAKGDNVLGEYDVWLAKEQLFTTKDEALTNMRGAVLFKLDQDRKRYGRYLAQVNNTMQQVKDSTVELQYAPVE